MRLSHSKGGKIKEKEANYCFLFVCTTRPRQVSSGRNMDAESSYLTTLEAQTQIGRRSESNFLWAPRQHQIRNMDLCARNETSTSPECVGAQTDALQSGTGNGSLETTNITYGNVSTLLIPQRVKGERAHRWLHTWRFIKSRNNDRTLCLLSVWHPFSCGVRCGEALGRFDSTLPLVIIRRQNSTALQENEL